MAAPTVAYSSTNSIAGALNGGDQSYTMSGIAVNDLIVLVGGHQQRAATPIGGVPEANRTWTQRYLDDTVVQAWGIWTCPVTSANLADTTVAGEGSGDSSDGAAYTVTVLRGVDLSNPVAATSSQVATRTPPAIVTPEADCLVMAIGTAGVSDNAVATLANYTNQAHSFANDTNKITVVTSVRVIAAAGTETPPEYIGLTATNNKSLTIAWRPTSAPAADTSKFFQFL